MWRGGARGGGKDYRIPHEEATFFESASIRATGTSCPCRVVLWVRIIAVPTHIHFSCFYNPSYGRILHDADWYHDA